MKQSSFFKEHRIPLLILLLVAFYYSLTTYFSYIANGSYGHDAGIFAGVGYAMQQGRILYTEIWENKGPLLYVINLLGVSINYFHGIYWLELFTLFLALFFSYKTALFIAENNKWIALIASVFSSLSLVYTLEGGNLSEEYALPFLCAGIYFVTKFFYNGRLSCVETIFFGACAGATLLLRANLVAFFLAMLIVVPIVLVIKKKGVLFVKLLGLSLAGCVLFILPFGIYLFANNALGACLDSAYLGILSGFIDIGKMARLTNVIAMVEELRLSGSLYIFISFAVLFIVLLANGKLKDSPAIGPLWICLLAFFITLLFNSITGVYHSHYFMSFVPVMVIPSAFVFHWIANLLPKEDARNVNGTVTAFLVALLLCYSMLPAIPGKVLNNAGNPDNPSYGFNLIKNYVLEHTAPEDTIQIIGGGAEGATTYYRTKKLPASKHIHYAAGNFTPEAKTRFADEITQGMMESYPRLIMFSVQGKDMYNDFVAHVSDKAAFNEFLSEYYTYQQTDLEYDVYLLNE